MHITQGESCQLNKFLFEKFDRYEGQRKLFGSFIKPAHLLYIFLFLFSLCCGPLFQTVFAGEDVPVTAPLNPDFTNWQKSLSSSSIKKLAAGMEEIHGYMPSPHDWSYLQSSPPMALKLRLGTSAAYDLRTIGGVTPVRDQGNCGSCWTFGTYGSLESWIMKRETSLDFSENNLKNYHGFDWGPCDGGNEDMSIAYLTRGSGPVIEANDPYHAWDDRPSPGGIPQKYVKNIWRFSTAGDIKNAIMNYGALYTTLYMNVGYYNSGTYTYYYSGSNTINHGVTVVGWDDNKVVPGAPGNGAWIIKNSWGTSFGQAGFFYVSYYDSRAVKEAAAFMDAVPVSDYVTIYQYDPLGQTSAVSYGSTTAWGANIFTPSQNGYLGAIGTTFLSNNTSYEISIYDNFSNGLFSSPLGSTVTGTATYAGYYTISLPALIPLTTGNNFAVVVKYTTPGYNYPIPMEEPFANYSSAATASAGQSYISSNGIAFTDITTYFANTNVNIKALTVPIDTVPGTPTGVSATAGNAQATVSFSTPASDGGSPIISYTVTSNPDGRTATGPSSPLTVTGLTNGTPYTFTVTATNAAGTGPASVPSNSVTPMTPMMVPGPPIGVSATAGDAQVTVSFSPPVSNGGSPITLYTVTSSPDGNMAIGSSGPLTVLGLTNGTSYTFTVTAKNAVGKGPSSAPSNSVTPREVSGDSVVMMHGGAVSGTYSSLQDAYNQCADRDIIQLQSATFTESPNFNLNMSVLLKGGYDSSFTFQSGLTVIHGTMTISAGTITVENLIIK
jgi:C1A family cysteine protease